MTEAEARMIKYLRVGGKILHSMRRIAEIYYPEEHDFHGNQGMGEELLRDAAKVLGEDWRDWEEQLDKELGNRRSEKQKS